MGKMWKRPPTRPKLLHMFLVFSAALGRSAAYEFALQMKMLACAPLVFKKVRDDLGGSMFV